MAATWLADVLRAAGLQVDESLVPDWQQRGHTDGPFAPVGVLGHHTAGSATGDLPSLGIVRDGRSDLAGPLANLMLSRSGVWVPIAAGRCWHAGAADNPAAWPWIPNGDGNGYLIGIEAESAGTGDWTPEQLDSYPRGVAALLVHLGVGADRFLGHLEWAPSRKIDPAGWPGGMTGFRQSIQSTPSGDPFMALTDAQQAAMATSVGKIEYALMSLVKPSTDQIPGVVAAIGKLAAGGTSVTAADIAAAIPANLAQQVVDALGAKLTKP